LVVGDFFRSKSPLLQYAEMACELITWLRSKTRILAHLPLSVLRAILTRWTAHYVAFRRLLQLYASLQALMYSDISKPESERVLISGDSKAKRKAREMVEIIKNQVFWHNIALYVSIFFNEIMLIYTGRITRYLEPLAIAANIVQESFCRIDQVLLTFGFLMMKYLDVKMSQDTVGRDAIINSIEARWAKSDQEVFVAAVLVNPFYRTLPFAPLPCFNQSQIRVLLTRLYRRFYKQEPPTIFIQHAYEFLGGTGLFNDIAGQVKYELDIASQEVSSISLYESDTDSDILTHRNGNQTLFQS
ncbi:hypothetical protein BDZ97DRAFT_1672403, partial [Flammula alnicola]